MYSEKLNPSVGSDDGVLGLGGGDDCGGLLGGLLGGGDCSGVSCDSLGRKYSGYYVCTGE